MRWRRTITTALVVVKISALRIFTRCKCGRAWGEEMELALDDGHLHCFLCTECGSTSESIRVPALLSDKAKDAVLFL